MKKILYLFSMLCVGYTASAQLSGTYTVYGTTPYAATIQDACDSLMLFGQSGPVVFDVRDNLIINEDVVLNAVAGNSAANTITFKSESNDSSKVRVFSTVGNTFTFNNVSHIKFNQISIGFNGVSGSVVSANNSHDFQFTNVTVAHAPTGGGWAISIDRDNGNDNFSFTNSNLWSTDDGIYLGSDVANITNPAISSSNITTDGYGIEYYAEKSLTNVTIDESTITSNNNYAAYVEGYYNKIDGMTITNSSFSAGTGIGFGSTAFYGYSDYIIENVTIDNSTFTSTNDGALYLDGYYTRLNNVDITNSNFTARRKGIELASDVLVSNITLDKDSSISNPTIDISTFEEAVYITGDGMVDNVSINNSYFEAPKTYGRQALEIASWSGAVKNISVKNSDLTGQSGIYIYAQTNGLNWTIDSNTISAYREALDLEPYYGIGSNISINHNILTADASDGLYIYSDANLKDVAITYNTINASSDGMDIESYYGSIENLTITNNIDTALSDGIYVYTYNLKNTTISDNSINSDSYGIDVEGSYLMDNVTSNNNFIEASSTGIYFYSGSNISNVTVSDNYVDAGSEGVYVYSSNSNISNLTIENDSIISSSEGIYVYCDALLIDAEINNNVIDANDYGMDIEGYYAGIESLNVKHNIVDATSKGIYIYTYASLKNVNISDSNYVNASTTALTIEADYGGINGLNIENGYYYSSTQEGGDIYADYGNIENMKIKNNTFVGDTINTNDYGLEIESDDSGMENIEVTYNNVYAGNYGIYIEADYGNAKNANVSSNNVWAKQEGIDFDGIGDNSMVSNNNIYRYDALTVADYGIYTYGYDGSSVGVTISGNYIEDNDSYGIYAEYSSDVTIENNYVRGTGANAAYGIYAYYLGGTTVINRNQLLFDDAYEGIVFYYSNATAANPSTIANNFISGTDYAIDVEDNDYVNVYHNSVSSNSNNNDQMVYLTNTTNINVLNNIFKADSASTGDIYYGDANANLVINNNVYDFDSTTVQMSADAFFGTNNSLVDFQAATTYDAASLMAAPMFVNDTTDLHINCSNNALVAAPFIGSVTTDVDGSSRNTTTTTFGADAITSTSADLLDATMAFSDTAVIYPKVTGASYLWSPGGATTPTLPLTDKGTYTLQLTDYCGNVFNDVIVVTFPVSVEDNLEARGLNVYPNPTQDKITLDFGLLMGEEIVINLIDLQGRIILSDQIKDQNGAYRKALDLSNLTEGIYFLRVSTKDENITRKVIKN